MEFLMNQSPGTYGILSAIILFIIIKIDPVYLLSKNIVKPKKITQQEAKKIMDTTKGWILLDVRTDMEYREGHIKGARLLPLQSIRKEKPKLLPNPDQPIFTYCHSGARSAQAAKKLAKLGYTDISNIGGIATWKYGITK